MNYQPEQLQKYDEQYVLKILDMYDFSTLNIPPQTLYNFRKEFDWYRPYLNFVAVLEIFPEMQSTMWYKNKFELIEDNYSLTRLLFIKDSKKQTRDEIITFLSEPAPEIDRFLQITSKVNNIVYFKRNYRESGIIQIAAVKVKP